MATNTTNFNLKKPAYTDTADIEDINGNMDKVDVSLNGLADAIAIVANNNTHAAISAGQYVYVHGHGTLAEGLYTANSNIAANATLSSSNLTADSAGGLNALHSKTTTQGITVTTPPGFSSFNIYKCGNVITVSAQTNSINVNSGDTLVTLPSDIKPTNTNIFPLFNYNNGKPIDGSLWAYATDGNIKYYGSNISATPVRFSIAYLTL